eukprot:gnl/Ergobibamus_cyprinoides/2284.p1 GENE.gnl/Ergobibamus_cyprinoides/2284~~gnl/Ergobibamus_cyprinoides/2284.p1  ORF type:complete len:231 (+),score=18.52 gnl/Ergobibamus_cyprinoides/2284:247-939(+)
MCPSWAPRAPSPPSCSLLAWPSSPSGPCAASLRLPRCVRLSPKPNPATSASGKSSLPLYLPSPASRCLPTSPPVWSPCSRATLSPLSPWTPPPLLNRSGSTLSSVRCPRVGRRGAAPEPWAVEAREKTRSKFIGATVSVHVDYTKEGSEGSKMLFATVKAGGADAAARLIEAGLATVVFHKEGEERAPAYDSLVALEAKAKAGKRKMHGTAAAPEHHVNDLSSNAPIPEP